MPKDKLDLKKMQGWLTVNKIAKDGSRTTILDRKNSLTDDAPQIQLYALAGEDWILDKIQAVKANSILASVDVEYTFPDPNVLRFTALFDEASFNDTLDEVRLFSTEANLTFSHVTGLSLFKDENIKIEIVWQLTIPIS